MSSLNDPKNQPIVIGVLVLVVAFAIGCILFYLHVFNPPQSYNPKLAGIPAQPTLGVGPNGPIPSGQSTVGMPASPSASAYPMPTAQGSGQYPGRPSGRGRLGAGNSMQASSVFPGANNAGAATLIVAAAPNARVDPFAPYGGIIRLQRPPRPPVASFVPNLVFFKVAPPGQQEQVQVADQTVQPVAPPITVNGVMLGGGAYALVDNGGQSLVLQPGDQIPNGGGQVVSIQSDSISVKVPGGQTVKIPVTSGQATGNQGSPGGQYGGGQYPGQYGGGPQYPGQGGGQYGGQMPPRAPGGGYPGG